MNYANAILNCQKKFGLNNNGRLFEPKDSSTNDQVINTATVILATRRPVHIGINDLTTEGTFQYATGGDLVYTNWSNGEPNNGSGIEDCVETRWDHGTKWNDGSCADLQPSICEMI